MNDDQRGGHTPTPPAPEPETEEEAEEEDGKPKRTVTYDAELNAMQGILRLLTKLDAKAKARAIAYLSSRFTNQ